MAGSKSRGSDRKEARAINDVEPGQEADAVLKKMPPTQKPRRRLTLFKPPSLEPNPPSLEHDEPRRLGRLCARALAQTECQPGHRRD